MADPNELITATRCGKTFKASRRTFAHIDYTIALLAKQHPGARLEIIQGCYNTTVEASAGTHDFDACIDVRIVGLDWWTAQAFLRACGWAAWYRHTGSWASVGNWHIHMVSLGYTTRVGIFVPGQVSDYLRHALGLKGQHDSGDDTSPFPKSIDDTYFDYDAWEDNVPYLDWPDADKKALAADVAKAVAAVIVDGAKLTLAQAAKQAANTPAMVRKLAAGLKISIGDK